MHVSDDMILRPVSTLEYNARKFGIVVSRSRIKGDISIAQFRKALDIISLRHPFLKASFYQVEKKAYFRTIKDFSLPLSIKENITTEEERNALYAEELNTPIHPYGKLWRVLLILDGHINDIHSGSGMDMILSVQHAICDGLSILNLAKEILGQVRALQHGTPLYENKPLPVTPPFDEFLPGIICRSGAEALPEQHLDYKQMDTLGRDLAIPKENCRIQFLSGQYSASEMKQLYRRCQEDQVSIHGIMAAFMMKAISENIVNPSGKDLQLLLRNPVSRRKQVTPPLGNQPLLCFVASELIVCAVGKGKTTLAIGRDIMNQLDQAIKIHKALKRYQAVVDSVLSGQMDKEKYVQVLTLSNAGVIDTPAEYGQFELLGTDFISSNKHHAIQLSFTTFRDRLDYIMLYTHPWYETALMRSLNGRFRELLLEFLDDSGE